MAERWRWNPLTAPPVAVGSSCPDPMPQQPDRRRPRRVGRSLLTSRARDNRRYATLSEAQLWNELRDRRLRQLKIRRQHPLGPFIVDFYCAEHALVIEVDGSVHDSITARRYDATREARLVAMGFRVIRFSVDDVMRNMELVLTAIAEACGKEYRGMS